MLHNLWHFSEAAMVLVSSFEVEVELSEKVKLNSFIMFGKSFFIYHSKKPIIICVIQREHGYLYCQTRKSY